MPSAQACGYYHPESPHSAKRREVPLRASGNEVRDSTGVSRMTRTLGEVSGVWRRPRALHSGADEPDTRPSPPPPRRVRRGEWFLEDVLVEKDERIHGLDPGGGGHLAASGQVGEECLHLLFAVTEAVPGLHVVETDIASDPIPVGAFGMDGVVTPPHEDAYFVMQFDRHTNPRGSGHVWSLVSRGTEAPLGDDITHGKSA